jgi:hypothetical protein
MKDALLRSANDTRLENSLLELLPNKKSSYEPPNNSLPLPQLIRSLAFPKSERNWL